MPAILIIATLCFSCPRLGFSRDYHDRGLFELRIRGVAQDFLTTHNDAGNTEWYAVTPHMENLVPGCREAIQVDWEREGGQTKDKNVRVHCSKTVNGGEWTVTVPVAVGNFEIETSHSDDKRHGLYEIREEARRLVFEYNKKHHTHWVALYPNLKVIVPRCARPLGARATWKGKYGIADGVAEVVCTKVRPVKPEILMTTAYKKGWTVKVPIACDLPPEKRNDQCRL
jgi:hypothetical protein